MRQRSISPSVNRNSLFSQCCSSWAKFNKNPPRIWPDHDENDPLVQALLDCESRLSAWLNESELNADLFRRDPLAALRAANMGLDEGLLGDLEETVTGIALKLC